MMLVPGYNIVSLFVAVAEMEGTGLGFEVTCGGGVKTKVGSSELGVGVTGDGETSEVLTGRSDADGLSPAVEFPDKDAVGMVVESDIDAVGTAVEPVASVPEPENPEEIILDDGDDGTAVGSEVGIPVKVPLTVPEGVPDGESDGVADGVVGGVMVAESDAVTIGVSVEIIAESLGVGVGSVPENTSVPVAMPDDGNMPESVVGNKLGMRVDKSD
jgi:hypothetical protein